MAWRFVLKKPRGCGKQPAGRIGAGRRALRVIVPQRPVLRNQDWAFYLLCCCESATTQVLPPEFSGARRVPAKPGDSGPKRRLYPLKPKKSGVRSFPPVANLKAWNIKGGEPDQGPLIEHRSGVSVPLCRRVSARDRLLDAILSLSKVGAAHQGDLGHHRLWARIVLGVWPDEPARIEGGSRHSCPTPEKPPVSWRVKDRLWSWVLVYRHAQSVGKNDP